MNRFLLVGRLPGRKRPCLYMQEGNIIRVLAHFKSDDSMQEFMAFEPRYTLTQPRKLVEARDKEPA